MSAAGLAELELPEFDELDPICAGRCSTGG